MNIKLAIVFGMLAVGVISCNTPTPPALAKCTTPEPMPTANVTVNTAVFKAQAKTLDSATIDGYDANRVLAQDKGVVGGDFILSDCSEGLLRQVTSISTANVGVDARGIEKVYLNTSDASLEDVVTSGDVGLDFGELDLNKATVVSALPGVQTRAINGTIPFNGIKIPLGTASSLTVGGSITQALKPKFDLTFSGGKLQHFQIGLSGSFSATLEGKLVSGEKLTNAAKELTIADYKFTRAFLVGIVPVVVVIEPKLILGAGVGTNSALQMTAKISPMVNLNFNIEFTRSANPQWKITPPTGSFSANPSFTVNTPDGGQVKTFAKLALGMKFYGIAGPEMTVKPFTLAKLSASDLSAGLNTGITVDGKVVAGFKVLGQGLEIASDSLSSTDLATNYKCTSTSCSILVSNPISEPLR
jgi:hypothetical protein